jgi:hypothetical protein
MTGLRLSEPHFRKRRHRQRAIPTIDADRSTRNCDACIMLAVSPDFQHRQKGIRFTFLRRK